MKFTVEITDEEIREEVKWLLVKRAVEKIESDLFGDQYTYNQRVYVDAIKSSVRQLLRENLDEITERAVKAAAKTIENRGIKELLAQSLNEGVKE